MPEKRKSRRLVLEWLVICVPISNWVVLKRAARKRTVKPSLISYKVLNIRQAYPFPDGR